MTNELPPRTPLECYSSFHCEQCNYEVGAGEKYMRYNNKTEIGIVFEFLCMRCTKERDGNNVMVNF